MKRSFFPSENQLLFRESLSRLVASSWDIEKKRKVAASDLGYCPDFWTRLADIGALSAFLPEEAGGMGGSGHDLMVIMDVIGRAAIISPFLESAVLGVVLLGGDRGEFAAALLEKIGTGTAILSVALHEPQSRYALNDVRMTARRGTGGFTLKGEKRCVAYAHAADCIVVPARTQGSGDSEDGITLFLLDPRQPGVSRTVHTAFDGSKTVSLRLDDVEISGERIIGEVDRGLSLLRRAVDLAILAQAAEAVGAMNYLLQATVDYVKLRQQFGVTISSYQAIQHRLVDMYTAVELSSALVQSALAGISGPTDTVAPADIAKVKLMTDRSARLVAQDAVQLHGGMGVSEETPIGHYFKRLTSISQSFADQFELQAIYRNAQRFN